jgi:hypothetical protein
MIDAPVEEGFRLKAVIAAESFLRMLRSATELYGDLDGLAIYLAVLSAGVAAASRDAEAMRLYSGAAPLPDQYHRPISRRAIAASTGLSRETTRRKIARLIADGHLVEDDNGVRGRSNILLERDNLTFAKGLLAEFERTTERLARIAAS